MSRRLDPQKRITKTVSGSSKTDLDSITSVPWQDLFEAGKGVDVVTGGVKPTAINDFELIGSKNYNTSENYTWIETEAELEREINASLSGSFNIYGVETTVSTEFLTKVKVSDRKITYIAECRIDEVDYESTGSSYSLTDEAKKLVQDSEKFRDQYGDYFIATLKGGSRFKALYICETDTKEKMDAFKTDIGVSKPIVFSADGAAEFEKIAKNHQASLSINIFMEGVSSSPGKLSNLTPADVNSQLNWFKENYSIIPVHAELMHYSTIDSSIPRIVNVAPDVFVDLSVLYTRLWTIRDYYANIPEYYSNIYMDDFTRLDSGIVANQSVLPNDTELLKKYLDQSSVLLLELTDVVDRQDFYYEVKAQVSKEPLRDHEMKADKIGDYWLYGFDQYNQSDAVSISPSPHTYQIDYKIGHRDHSFSFDATNWLLVGWSVKSNKNDNGSWKKTCDHVLLESKATIYTRSEYDRGIDYTVTWYHVDIEDYKFK